MPPTSAATAASGVQRVPDVREGGLQAESGEHDARDHREVDQRVRVARELVLLLARRRAREPALGGPDGDVEVAPERRGDRDGEDRGGDDDAEVSDRVGAHADSDDRLAEGDDDVETSPCRSAK